LGHAERHAEILRRVRSAGVKNAPRLHLRSR
jgi:hypothetical protein